MALFIPWILSALYVTPEIDQLGAEAAMAVIGLRAILDAKPKWKAAQRKEATFLGKQIGADILEFLRRPDFEPARALPDFNFKTASKLLKDAGKPDQAEALYLALKNPDLATAVTHVATRAIGYLRGVLPRRVHEGLDGTVMLPPTGQAQARFARAWSVICDPLIVLRDLREGCLTADMGQTLKLLFPAISQTVDVAIHSGLTEMKANRKTWQLSIAKDRQLRVLLGLQAPNVTLLQQIQAVYAQEAQALAAGKQGTNGKLKIDSSKTETAGQHAEQSNNAA